MHGIHKKVLRRDCIYNIEKTDLEMGPQGFWGSGENGYLFPGSWGALVIILGKLRSRLVVLGI